MFTRSLIYDSTTTILPCSGGHSCPDILEMDSGDFAVIGTDITSVAAGRLPTGSGCGPEERIVRVPRAIMARAKGRMPERA